MYKEFKNENDIVGKKQLLDYDLWPEMGEGQS